MRMRITNLTEKNLTQTNLITSDIHLFAFKNSGTEKEIFMKFGTEITPLESGPKLYFLFFTIRNTNVTDAQSGEVGRRVRVILCACASLT
jgi:hypothetical protein